MKTNLLKTLGLPVVLALLLAGCSVDDPDHPTGLQAPPVFSSYVALGNSLTAGYMDSGLMLRGQLDSYPKMIAGQLGLGDGFSQPYVDRPGIGSTDVGDGMVAGVLAFNPSTGAIAPLGITPEAAVPGLLLYATQLTPYHNLGVPGITLADLFNGYTEENSQSGSPFLRFINRYELYGNEERFATLYDLTGEPQSVSYQTCSTGWQAVAKGPTVATVWIGNNDVLGGATGGNPTADNMTDPNLFAALYNEMLQLLAGGLLQRTGFPAVIAVGNIPDVVDAAYFISEATFEAAAGGPWPWGYEEGSAQLLTFRVLSWIADPANQGTAIPSGYTLDSAEVTLVNQYVAGYNQAISNIVNAVNAAGVAKVGLADMNSTLRELPEAQKTHFMLLLPQMGNDVEAAAATTAFSLDGVHPNNHGYAIAANAFIEVINTVAGTEVPTVDPSTYTWDPTYTPAGKARPAVAAVPHLTPEAAAAMAAIWQ